MSLANLFTDPLHQKVTLRLLECLIQSLCKNLDYKFFNVDFNDSDAFDFDAFDNNAFKSMNEGLYYPS